MGLKKRKEKQISGESTMILFVICVCYTVICRLWNKDCVDGSRSTHGGMENVDYM